MTGSPPADPGIAPVYRDDPRLQPLIGPGAPFEVEAVVLDGVPLRDFVRAPRTIVDLFHMGAAHEALVNVVLDDERLTFADVRRRSRSLARELQSTFGVRPGDRVAIAMRNLPEFVVSFWGAALTGAIVVPLNSWWTGGELTYALRNAGVSVVFADDERVERIVADGRPEGVDLVGVRVGWRRRAVRRADRGYAVGRRRHRAARPGRPGDAAVHVGHDRAPEGSADHEPGDGGEPLEHGVRRRPGVDHRRAATRPGASAGHAVDRPPVPHRRRVRHRREARWAAPRWC